MGQEAVMGEQEIGSIAASRVRPSRCVDEAGAVDVDVVVTIGAETLSGEVSLSRGRRATKAGDYDAYMACGGSPDAWVSGALLAALQDRLDGDDLHAALGRVEEAAAYAAEAARA